MSYSTNNSNYWKSTISKRVGFPADSIESEVITLNSGLATLSGVDGGSFYSGGTDVLDQVFYFDQTVSSYPANKTFTTVSADNTSEIQYHSEGVFAQVTSDTNIRFLSWQTSATATSLDIVRHYIPDSSPMEVRHGWLYWTTNGLTAAITISEIPSDAFLFAPHYGQYTPRNMKWDSGQSVSSRPIHTVITNTTTMTVTLSDSITGSKGKLVPYQIIMPSGDL